MDDKRWLNSVVLNYMW